MLHGIHFFLSFIFHYTSLLLISFFSFLTSLIYAPLPLHIFRIIKKICLFNAELKCVFFQELPAKSPGNTVYLFPIWCLFYLCFLCIISQEINVPISASLFYLYISACSMYIVNSWWISNWMDEMWLFNGKQLFSSYSD